MEQVVTIVNPTSDRAHHSTKGDRSQILTYHLLEGVLRRVSHSIYTQEFVLRGGMLTRLWVTQGRRIAVDVDFLALYPFDMSGTETRFRNIFSFSDFTDGVVFKLDSLRVQGIWMETEFPGLRVNIDGVVGDFQSNIQIDVGFGDPIVPEPVWIDYPTLVTAEVVRLLAVRPETMLGWKLHGLVEQGVKRWRPKDLYDVMLLSTEVELDEGVIPSAIATAFESRNTPLQEVLDILSMPQWWNNSRNRSRWKWYTRRMGEQVMPEDYATVVDIVTGRWQKVVYLTQRRRGAEKR
jgi:hypothetical protein